MNPQAQILYQHLQAYSLDSEGASFSFSTRLAKENNWTKAYSLRVIDEYKKFVLLAMVAGHTVSPSDQVDQVWHLHLTYTRAYWDEFCKDILARPLHHEPTRGGHTEKQKFWQLYQQTLDSYECLFNEKPPTDIWPSPELRFGRDVHFVRVNRRQHWLIPKPIWSWPRQTWQQVRVLPLLLLLCVVISGCAAVSPLLVSSMVVGEVKWFDDFMALSANEFLSFYIGTALSLLFIISALYKDDETKPYAIEDVNLSAEQLAYLAGGPDRAIDTALVTLIEQGLVKLSEDKQRFELVEPAAISQLRDSPNQTFKQTEVYQPKPLVEHAIIEAISNGPHEISTLLKAVEYSTSAIYDDLVAKKLWGAGDKSIQHKVGLLLAPLILIGVARLFHGLSVGHPVGFLTALLILTLAIPLMFGLGKRTLYGRQVLERYKKDNASSLSSQSLCYAVAVAGLSVLANTAMADIGQSLISRYNNDSGGGDAGCGGGGCGGCGGCGG